MKTKFFLFMSIVMGLFLASCDDDDIVINNKPLLDESSVVTGSADVTATTATLYGTVKGLSGQSDKAYTTGFNYGTDQNALGSSVTAAYDGETFTATLSGLTENTVIYYQAYVTLQGKVTYTGEVKSLVTTDATVTTKPASAVDHASALLAGSQSEAPADATFGIVIAADSNPEAVRAGLIVPASGEPAADFAVEMTGLRPAQTYYYAAYADLGSGVLYGEVETFTTADYDFDLDNDLVDLGLSVKWARFNIGAKNPEDFGGLFGFGDLTGINNSIERDGYALEDTYKTDKDVAFASYQGKVTLPTAADFEELFARCSAEWTEENGVAGYKLTGPNGNSIFLPAAGSRTINTVEGRGSVGYYLTGTVNASNTEYAVTYQFNASTKAKATTPVYQAVAVRPVSTARNVPFVRELLNTKWYLDNGQDGKQHVYPGPFTQFGITDTWATVSNKQPNIYQDIYWEMGTDNGWIGYTYGRDYGYMEFAADGTVTIERITYAEDGTPTTTSETGSYTIDEAAKTIDIDVDVLAAETWIGTKKGKLNILAMDEDGLRIALPADDTYAYALNYYSEAKRVKDETIPVSITAIDSDFNGTWGTVIENIAPAELYGKHTVTYNGAMKNAGVFLLELKELHSRFPNAIVTIDEIKADGATVEFDANRFYYGDLEDNGTFRVQLFNIYGKGSADNKVTESPFSNNTEPLAFEPAAAFNSSLEITFTIAEMPASYTVNLIAISAEWGGVWDFTTPDANFAVSLTDGKYTISKSEFDITMTSADNANADCSGGTIMTFVNINDLMAAFPGTYSTLDALYLDGTEVTGYDPEKIANSNDGNAYRLELFNCFGITKDDCAFGTRDGDVMHELGFSQSVRVKFTIQHLFPVPQW